MMRQSGQGAINLLGALFVTLLVGAFSIDAGLYFAANRGMQNAADAASLAAVTELFKSTDPDVESRFAQAREVAQNFSEKNMGNELDENDIEFGYVDPHYREI